MKYWHLLIVILALQVCIAPTGGADSQLTEVTRESIGTQPLSLRVETEAYDDDTIAFDVFVAASRDAISPHREGRLEIARQDLPKTVKGQMPTFPRPMIWCNFQEVEKDGVLQYSFGVHREMLLKASFEFRNYDAGGMPSMDVYVFRLSEFAAKE